MVKETKENREIKTVETTSADRASAARQCMRIELPNGTMLLIAGTAKLDGNGRIVPEDFRAQTWQTFQNISARLEEEGATWDNVVRTTCHLRDLDRDGEHFSEMRTWFYTEIGLEAHPANTNIQSPIHPQDLLIEIEAIAILPHRHSS